MKTVLPAIFLVFFSLAPIPSSQNRENGFDVLVGSWEGVIVTGDTRLQTVFHLKSDGDRALTGTIDSPDQGVFGIPISGIEFGDKNTVTIDVALTGAVYVARIDQDGQRLTGTWSQRGTELFLECHRAQDPLLLPSGLRERLEGTWEGRLATGAVELRLVFHLQVQADGSLLGTMDSPDQGAKGITITRVDSLGSGRVRISIGSVGASFEAALGQAGTLAGTFHQGGVILPLELAWVETPTRVNRPQTPQLPFPYRAEEVVYENASDNVELAGTLNLPTGEGPFAAILMITGSGAQDRDETIFEHRPFLVIADHLTRAGLAVLRVDDRGIGGSGVGSEPATTVDLADDVRAGVAYLRNRPEIDGDLVGLIGHSEGGIIAPLVASEDLKLAFIVLIAGTGLVGEEILYLQGELIARASGMSEQVVASNRHTQEQLFTIMKNDGLPSGEARRQMSEILRADKNIPKGKEGDAFISTQLDQLDSAWLRHFIQHDPAPVLRRVRCPVLALNGMLDLQVPWQQNLDAIRNALTSGGNLDVTIMELPGLNHLMQRAETGLITEYGEIEETFAPEVLEIMTKWILDRVSNRIRVISRRH